MGVRALLVRAHDDNHGSFLNVPLVQSRLRKLLLEVGFLDDYENPWLEVPRGWRTRRSVNQLLDDVVWHGFRAEGSSASSALNRFQQFHRLTQKRLRGLS